MVWVNDSLSLTGSASVRPVSTQTCEGRGLAVVAAPVTGLPGPAVPDDSYPFEWLGLDLPSGPLNLRITAFDADGNEVSTEVPGCVGGRPCSTRA